MRLVFLGSGAFGLPTLEALIRDGHEVAAVVTQPARPAGRGRKETPTPIAEAASRAGLTVWPVENVNDPGVVERIVGTGATLAVVVAFGQWIGRRVREGLPRGCINLHGSLLPRYRGAGPIQWAIIHGERQTGVTVFRVVKAMDAGPMLGKAETHIADDETYGSLHDRLADMGPAVVTDALRQFEGGADPSGEPQDESAVTLAPKLTKADGMLDFSLTARELSCRIRGTWPWPGGTCRFVSADGAREEDVTIALAAEAATSTFGGAPGTITEDLQVSAGVGAIAIHEIKPSGGRLMPWADYVNGRHIKPGDRLASIAPTSR